MLMKKKNLKLKKHVRQIPNEDFLHDANVLSSQALYKIKIEEGEKLRLKERKDPKETRKA